MFTLALLLAIQIAPQSADLPNRQPQLASDGTLLGLTYGAGNSIFFMSSADSGQTWSKPVLVATPGKMSLGMRRGPRIAMTSQAIVISAVAGERGGGQDGDLIAWRSVDGGQTWSAGKSINDIVASAREGLHTMVAGPNNTLFAAWLDLRRQGTRIYGSVSRNGGATWSPNMLVYESPAGTVCQCCHPSAAIDDQGRIYVMFRNVLDGNRDMYLVRSENGGGSFGPTSKLGTGAWKLDACPMDGGALQIDAGGSPITVWKRESDIFLSLRPEAEQDLGAGRQPILAATPRGPAVAWTEGKTLKVVAPGQQNPASLDNEAVFPSMVALRDRGVVLAWEQGRSIVVRVVD